MLQHSNSDVSSKLKVTFIYYNIHVWGMSDYPMLIQDSIVETITRQPFIKIIIKIKIR